MTPMTSRDALNNSVSLHLAQKYAHGSENAAC